MLKNIKLSIHKQLGFSLIELVIVVAIIGILASVALPSYIEQVRKSKRADLVSNVLECASIQERRFSVNNSYEATACDALSTANDNYTIATTLTNTTANGNSNGYTITVTPIGSMASDAKCTQFTYNNLGLKGATGSGADSVSDCWRD